jgi:uncharacterized protein YkwD
VPVLVLGGLWLAGGGRPAPSPAAATAPAADPPPAAVSGTASAAAAAALPAAIPAALPATGPGQPAPGACVPAASVLCAPRPIHVSLAQVPVRRSVRRPAARATAGPAASGSATAASPAAAASGTSPGSPAAQSASPAGQVLALINQARAEAGLPPLTVTAGLVASASAHDLRMAGGCGLTHQCPGEPAIGDRETAAGVTWTAAGENIGDGGPVADSTAAAAQMAVTLTQDMLDEQPPDDGHRLNILSTAFTHIGIAVYRDSAGTVWLTQDFSN